MSECASGRPSARPGELQRALRRSPLITVIAGSVYTKMKVPNIRGT